MAQMCPDEGLDLWLGQFPLNTAKYTSPLSLKLFTSQTASTVITHELPLSEAARGYDMFLKKEDNCEKVVLKPAA